MSPEHLTRDEAFGQRRQLTSLDRLNTWVSGLAVRRMARLEGARFGDFGCGFEARFARSVLPLVDSAVLVDIALSDEVARLPRVTAIEGRVESVLAELPDESLDVIACLSVLEHLWRPEEVIAECHRLLAPGGTLLINVPSWFGKRILEFMSFRLDILPRDEMDDHKHYFASRDLWPMLVSAGFSPSRIRCRPYKLATCTFGRARKNQEATV